MSQDAFKKFAKQKKNSQIKEEFRQEKKNAKKERAAYFDKIKENAGKIIENMNDIVWAVNPINDTMEQILVRMQSFASSLLEKKNIMFQFNVDDLLASVKLSMEERKNFYLIFKEAIHNAFKYAGCKNVMACISYNHKNILMNIQDDGKGFNQDKLISSKTGIGLKNMKSRANLIGGSFSIHSETESGTIISIIIPLTSHK